MKPGVFRLTCEPPGVQLNGSDQHPVMTRLEAGAIVIVRDIAQPPSHLLTVEADGKSVTVFWADLQARAVQIQAASKNNL